MENSLSAGKLANPTVYYKTVRLRETVPYFGNQDSHNDHRSTESLGRQKWLKWGKHLPQRGNLLSFRDSNKSIIIQNHQSFISSIDGP